MWFIFNLQKKKKFEIAAGIYTYIQMVYGQNALFIIFVLKALVEPQGVRRCRDEFSTTPVS
jgi:hypothetical protein